MSGLGDTMSGELLTERVKVEKARYQSHRNVYKAIFGEDAVWCRPIIHVVHSPGPGPGPGP